MGVVLVWLRLDLRRRWRPLVVLGLLIAVSAGTVLTAVAGARRGASALDRLLDVTLPATAAVLPNQPGFDWAAVRKLPQVAALATFPIAGVDIEGIPPETFPSTFASGDPEMTSSVERPVVLEGRLADPTRADEAVVTPAFVDNYGKGVGDTVTVRLLKPETTDRAWQYDSAAAQPDGPVIPTRIVGVIRSYWFSDQVGGKGRLIPSTALFQQYRSNLLGAGESVFINALVRLHRGAADLPAFRADLASLTGRTDIDFLEQTAFARKDRQTSAFESACLLAFGLAALLAAIVLVGQAIARYTAATVADLQVLRPIGMTPGQVILAACAGPALVSVLGTGLGVGAAVLASRWMPFGAPALLEPEPGMHADWLVLGPGWAALTVAVAGGAAAAAWLAIGAARIGVPPRRSAAARGVARTGLPVSVVIGTRFALETGRGHSALPVRPALIGAVTGVLGVLAALTFSSGVADAAAHPERFGQTHQLEMPFGLSSEDSVPSQPALAAAAADPDVAGVNDARVEVASVGDTSVALYTHHPVGAAVPAVVTAGRLPDTAGEIALAPASARAIGADVGSIISLTGTRGARTMTVTGIGFVPIGPHNAYDEGGWLTPGGYQQLFDGFKFHTAQITVRPGADPASVIPRLTQSAGAAAGVDAVQIRPVEPVPAVAQIKDVEALPLVLGGFLALLAVGAVGHALATAVRRRRYDVAVLRALGMTRWQSRGVVVTQASVLAGIGLIFGIPLGLALGRTLWRVVADLTPLLYVPPVAVAALVLIVPLALLIANLLAAIPGQRAVRLRIGQVLRAE